MPSFELGHGYLPPSLWREGILHLPDCLVAPYRRELERTGSLEEASGPSPRDAEIVGGSSEQETQTHFTHRFAASAVRTEYLVLDPAQVFRSVCCDLLRLLADGTVAVLDVPCGAGAGILGVLTTLCEMRALECLPRLTLNIMITAGDISETVRGLYGRLLEAAEPSLREQGIRIQWRVFSWDAADEATTAAIVDQLFGATVSEQYLVLIAAFSGDGTGQFDAFSRSFQHIAARLHDRPATVLWVEPKMAKAATFLDRIEALFAQLFGRILSATPRRIGHFRWQHPFKADVLNGSAEVLGHRRTLR